MEEHIKYAQSIGADFVEITSVFSKRNSLGASNSKVAEISSGINNGFCARVMCGRRWGCAFSNKEDYRHLIEDAIRNASFCGEEQDIDIQKPIKKHFKTRVKINPEDVEIAEKKKLLCGISSKEQDCVANLSLNYVDLVKSVRYVNSEGSRLDWKDTLTHLSCSAHARYSDRFESHFDVLASHQGYELCKDISGFCKEVMKTAAEKLKAGPAKKGRFPVIVDPKLGGVFVHEAVGHACEADLLLNNNSVFRGRIGSQIGPEDMNICDEGDIHGSWGWVPFDNEGILGSKTTLMKKGVLCGRLHSRTTAKKFGDRPTGNGRVQSLGYKAIPRMTNIYVENGDSSFEEMLSEVKRGYYLKRSAGGQVDPSTGEFLFNALESFWIENGEIRKRAKEVSMIGNILTTLKDVTLLGKDMRINGGGACGKLGQYVLTGDGTPHMLIEKVKIGGRD